MSQSRPSAEADVRSTRRSFLRGSAAAAAGAAPLALPSSAAAWWTPQPRRINRNIVVLGSGFGGAVTALRLAQAGANVTLIERGRRWASGQPDTFATAAAPDKRVNWKSNVNQASALAGAIGGFKFFYEQYAGLHERIDGEGMSIVCGAAYGGGSLPYQGMSVQPRADLFARVMPRELDYDELDRRWYPLASKMLGIAPMPDDIWQSKEYLGSRRFAEIVRACGFPEVTRVPMVVDWDIVRQEIRGERPPIYVNADVAYGSNSPAKKSLDTNYLPAAERTGRVEVATLHDVREIGRDAQGRWTLDVRRLNERADEVERLEVTCDALFLSAGSGNTSKLLVEAKGKGRIPDLPSDTGRYWANNGDLITMSLLPEPLGADQYDGGPANVATFDWDNPAGPVTLLYAPAPLPYGLNSFGGIGIHLPGGHGRFEYDWLSGKARLKFPPGNRNPAIDEARRRTEKLAKAANAFITIDQTAIEPTTWHPLGGAVIGKVCDAYGRVQGQQGLYVTDGALIPGSTACANPSLTITALAERNVAKVIQQDLAGILAKRR